eukprot:5585559-Pyramimonas_sp.AAC.1
MRTDGSGRVLVAVGRAGLAGWQHSVKRGEFMASKELLQNAEGFQKIRCVANSSYAVRGAAKLRSGKLPKSQKD